MANDYIVHKAVEWDALSVKTKQALQQPTDWVVTPKYDGCHAIFIFEDGKCVGTYSRSGERVYSMQHIAEALKFHYDLGQGRWAICGEAWSFDKEFNVISGWFRKQSNVADLGFVPFDIVPWHYNDGQTTGPVILLNPQGGGPGYLNRLKAIINKFKPTVWSKVQLPVYAVYQGQTYAQVIEKAAEQARFYKAKGTYDGVIIAQANGQYSVGAGKGGEFIKVKPLLSETVTVAGYEEAVGEKTGKRTVALTFNLAGRMQRVSTGLTQAQVEDICDNFKENWKDRFIEVEAMGLTVNGYLREPRFKGFRND